MPKRTLGYGAHLATLIVAASIACVPLKRSSGGESCLGEDWRTALMRGHLTRLALAASADTLTYFQRRLRISPLVPPSIELVRDPRVCDRARAEFDRIDRRPDGRTRTRVYVLRMRGAYFVRDPADETGRLDRWAYAAVFDSSWTYQFYQGFYRCTGGSGPAGDLRCPSQR